MLLCQGVFYKVVIADRLVSYVTTVTNGYETYSALTLWAASFLYVIELYCDFAGYSMVVIAIGEMFGFRIDDNFRRPFFSMTVREFWNRWHISLGRWLRDYVYIPLGGNRNGKVRKIINILIVYIVSGIWHNNTINYIVWGLLNGILVALSPGNLRNKMSQVASTFFTFICFVLTMTIFRIDGIVNATRYILKMFTDVHFGMQYFIELVMPFSGDYSSVSKCLVIILFICISFIIEYREERRLNTNNYRKNVFYVMAILLFGLLGESSFMYAIF